MRPCCDDQLQMHRRANEMSSAWTGFTVRALFIRPSFLAEAALGLSLSSVVPRKAMMLLVLPSV